MKNYNAKKNCYSANVACDCRKRQHCFGRTSREKRLLLSEHYVAMVEEEERNREKVHASDKLVASAEIRPEGGGTTFTE